MSQTATDDTATDEVDDDTSADLDPEALKRELAKARNQAAQYRSQAKKAQEERDAAKNATLSDQERVLKERDDLKAENSQLKAATTAVQLEKSTVAMASRLGFQDPEDAYALVDRSAIVIDDAGKATNLEELLKGILDAKPYLGRGQQPTGGGTSNPGPRTAPAGKLDMNSVLREKFGHR